MVLPLDARPAGTVSDKPFRGIDDAPQGPPLAEVPPPGRTVDLLEKAVKL
jgi:hypothetical protein